MNAHLGDDLELYALGDLGPDEREKVDAHLAECAACTRAVGEAEEALAHLADLLPAYRAPRRAPAPISAARRGALAAAFVGGLLVAGLTLAFVNFNAAPNNEDVRAQIAMTHAHFAHVSLEPLAPDAPSAKVIYALDRSWLYAIAGDGHAGYHLAALDGTNRAELGTLVAHGASASLFVEHPGPLHEVVLLRGDRVVARGIVR